MIGYSVVNYHFNTFTYESDEKNIRLSINYTANHSEGVWKWNGSHSDTKIGNEAFEECFERFVDAHVRKYFDKYLTFDRPPSTRFSCTNVTVRAQEPDLEEICYLGRVSLKQSQQNSQEKKVVQEPLEEKFSQLSIQKVKSKPEVNPHAWACCVIMDRLEYVATAKKSSH